MKWFWGPGFTAAKNMCDAECEQLEEESDKKFKSQLLSNGECSCIRI